MVQTTDFSFCIFFFESQLLLISDVIYIYIYIRLCCNLVSALQNTWSALSWMCTAQTPGATSEGSTLGGAAAGGARSQGSQTGLGELAEFGTERSLGLREAGVAFGSGKADFSVPLGY